MYHIQARIEGAYVEYGAYRDGEPGEPKQVGAYTGYATMPEIIKELNRIGVEFDVVPPLVCNG